MNKIGIMIVAVICNIFYCSAKDIIGSVKNEKDEPLEYVAIHLSGTKYGSVTDSLGVFFIKDVPAGNYKLMASLSFYTTKEINISIANETLTSIPPIILEVSDQELGEIIISGNGHTYTTRRPSGSIRLDRPLIDVPQNIQVINATMLADQQILNMNDGLVRNISGATRVEHWGDLYARINMRGSRAAAFREGMNVTSSWGPLNEDMSVVEAIEFVKGPAGFMMSNGEPSGIYNVVTKKPTGYTRGQAGFTFGRYDLYRATLDLDGKLSDDGKLLYRLNVMGQTQNSFRANNFVKRYSVAPVIRYLIDDKTQLTAEYTLQQVQMSNVGSYYNFSPMGYATLPKDATPIAPGIAPTNITDHSLIVNLQHKFNKDWKLTAQAAYFYYNQQGSSMWLDSITSEGFVRRTVSIWDAINEMKFGQAFINGKAQTGNITHHILGGLDLGNKTYWADWSQSIPLDPNDHLFNPSDPNPANGTPANYTYPEFDRSRSIKERSNGPQMSISYTGIYLQDEIGFLNDDLRLTLAGRYTILKDNQYGTIYDQKYFSPRVGLSYSLNRNTSFYALYDQSFVPQTGKRKDGERVEPITGNNMEIGFKKSWLGGKWNSTISAYRILKNNQLSADPEDTENVGYVLQLGQTKTEGVEIDILGEIISGLNLMANYAYTDSKISKETKTQAKGTKLPGYAKHNFNISLRYRFNEGVLKGFNINAGTTSLIDRTAWSVATEEQQQLADYFKLDAGIGWNNAKMGINLSVFNVLDKYLYSGSPYLYNYKNPSTGASESLVFYAWQTESPRSYKLSITYNF